MKRKCKTEIDQQFFKELATEQDIDQHVQRLQTIHRNKETKRLSLKHPSYKESELDFQAKKLHKLILQSGESDQISYKYQDVCEQFGIDILQLRKYKTIEDKQNYVIRCSTDKIKTAIETLIEKQKEPEQQVKDKKLDLYGWLKVKSQYQELKHMLQYTLVELVQQKDNSQLIQEFFEKLQQKNLKRHHTTESKEQRDFSTHHTYRIQQETQKEEESRLKLNVPQYEFSNPDLFFEWNQAVEEGYIKANKKLVDIGCRTIRKQLSNGLNAKKREKLIERHVEGNYMTEDELRYLASTSQLMIRCLDKRFIQKAINFLDKDCLDQIEQNIAEQTLQMYNYMITDQKQKRNQYFQELNQQKRIQIKKKSKVYEKQQQVQSNVSQVKILKKKLINMLKDISKKKQLKVAAEKQKRKILQIQRQQGNPLANIYVQKFKEIVMGVVGKMREEKTTFKKDRYVEFLDRNAAKPPAPILYSIGNEEYDAKKSKRTFHPPSKVIANISEDKFNIDKPEIQKKQIKSYKLGIRNYEVSKKSFATYYSGGPQSQRQYASPELQYFNQPTNLHPPQNNWITSEAEVAAINKIKKAIKRYIQKKAIDKLIVKKEFKRNREIEMKIQKCLQAKSFFQQLHQELDRRQSERLKDITMHEPPKLDFRNLQKLPSDSNSPQIPREKHQIQINLTNLNRLQSDALDTAKRVENEIKELNRKKRMMKFSKQKELSEAKLKNRKLIVAAKMKNLIVAQNAGFHYTQLDTKLLDKYGNSPLYYAAKNGDEQFCRFLMNLGADVNQRCQNGNTPLHMAFLSNNIQIIIDFLNHEGDLNILNIENFTPLAFGSEEILKKLNLFKSIASVSRTKPRTIDNHDLFQKKQVPSDMIEYEDCLTYDRYALKLIM